ncbi:MAG: hypothetical protein EXS13_03020 [Planctomycetes bacterium]|nr:hypothetical protein [Planctomycetota bacterium]
MTMDNRPMADGDAVRPSRDSTVAPAGSPSPSAPTAAATGLPAAVAADGFDFAIEEIAPTDRLKEGFTGQER